MSAKDYLDIDSGNDGNVDDTTSRKRARGDKLSPFLHESVLMECGKGEQQYRRKKAVWRAGPLLSWYQETVVICISDNHVNTN